MYFESYKAWRGTGMIDNSRPNEDCDQHSVFLGLLPPPATFPSRSFLRLLPSLSPPVLSFPGTHRTVLLSPFSILSNLGKEPPRHTQNTQNIQIHICKKTHMYVYEIHLYSVYSRLDFFHPYTHSFIYSMDDYSVPVQS